jgi:hypothetical protein
VAESCRDAQPVLGSLPVSAVPRGLGSVANVVAADVEDEDVVPSCAGSSDVVVVPLAGAVSDGVGSVVDDSDGFGAGVDVAGLVEVSVLVGVVVLVAVPVVCVDVVVGSVLGVSVGEVVGPGVVGVPVVCVSVGEGVG